MKTLPRPLAPSALAGIALLALSSAPLSLHAQSKPADTAPGFSIETEMLTYRALESNGEAIACDVAAYLYGTRTDFKSVPTGAVCNVGSASGPANLAVLVLPFDATVIANFQIWRSDVQTMAEFETRGQAACNATPPPRSDNQTAPPGVEGRGLTASAADAAGLFTPAGAAISTASGILGLFASDHTSAPVGGTIEDQAFMDNVSRELRAVNIAVLMPGVYNPYSLASVDPTRSPFLIALDKLLHTRDCLVRTRSLDDPDVKNIDAFLAVLAATPAPDKAAATDSQPAPSHLIAVLAADNLAQRLGADPATARIPDSPPQHILLVKALESGGTVTRSTNLLGTRISYSGGSVGTYALFDLNGQLECSGNVYDYAGPLPAKDFQKHLRAFVPDPASQVIFQRGVCHAR